MSVYVRDRRSGPRIGNTAVHTRCERHTATHAKTWTYGPQALPSSWFLSLSPAPHSSTQEHTGICDLQQASSRPTAVAVSNPDPQAARRQTSLLHGASL